MKAIILISSIFYIIGLKIGNQIDLTTKNTPVEKISTTKISSPETEKTYQFNGTAANQMKTDSVKNLSTEEDLINSSK